MRLRGDFIQMREMEKWLESLLITVAMLAFGYYFNWPDPFFVKAQFPWIWFAPLLIALRYGIAPGMVSVALICSSCLLMQRSGLLAGEFPTTFMLGGVMLTLISGQFSNLWNQRLRRSDLLSSHAQERFEQLSRSYFMVRLSHDRLEQNLIIRPVTLRDAMVDLRALLSRQGGGINSETASALISILVHYCSLESAAIYLMDERGWMQKTAVAACGRGAGYKPDDLLLQAAVESNNIAYQSASRLRDDENSAYLVAAPMKTSSGRLIGVLLVSEMPFLSLQRETLQILGVLLAYASDQTEAAQDARRVLAVFQDCPAMFASELIKMVRLKHDLDVDSSLVVLNIAPTPHMEDVCIALERQQRGLDHGWRRSLGWGAQFVTLMPFSGLAAVDGYRMRVNDMLRKKFDIVIGEGDVTISSASVSADDSLKQLAELLAANS